MSFFLFFSFLSTKTSAREIGKLDRCGGVYYANADSETLVVRYIYEWQQTVRLCMQFLLSSNLKLKRAQMREVRERTSQDKGKELNVPDAKKLLLDDPVQDT